MIIHRQNNYSEPFDSNKPISKADENYLILRTIMEGPDTGRRYGTSFGALYTMMECIDSIADSEEQKKELSEKYRKIEDAYFDLLEDLTKLRESRPDTFGDHALYVKGKFDVAKTKEELESEHEHMTEDFKKWLNSDTKKDETGIFVGAKPGYNKETYKKMTDILTNREKEFGLSAGEVAKLGGAFGAGMLAKYLVGKRRDKRIKRYLDKKYGKEDKK